MIMKQLIVLICLMMGVNIMAENPQTPYSKKVLGLDETVNIHLQEVEFRDDHIINIVASCVPEIKDSCRLENKNNYIRMCFVNENPTQIVLYPEIIPCHFTIDFWKNNRKDINGYLYIDDIMIIVQGKSAKKYIRKKQTSKILTIKHYPPSNARDWPFWRYTINNYVVTKERHLTKTPYILF